MQIIEFEKTPLSLVQDWIVKNAQHGYWSILAGRVSQKTGEKYTNNQVMVMVKTLSTSEEDHKKELLVKEMLSFMESQGHDMPNYIKEVIK